MNTDTKVVLTVVRAVALALVASIAAIVLLAMLGKTIPDGLGDVAQGALVAISALLARTSSSPDQPQPVTVENEADAPVPTVESKGTRK